MQFEGQRGFLRSRAGRGFLFFVSASALLAAAIGYGLYHSNLRWYEASKTEEKLTAMELANAFFLSYSEIRSRYLGEEAPVPESFRAHSIERFNQERDPKEGMRLILVGVPERQIRIAPVDSDMTRAIREMMASSERKPTARRVMIDGQPFLRTLHASIAARPSCVECHNAIQQGLPQWQLGDMMGAYALDVPLASFLRKARREAILAAAAIFLIACGIGLQLFRLQFRRVVDEIEQRAHRRLTDAIENLRDGFAIYDAESRLVLGNEAHQRYSALSEESWPRASRPSAGDGTAAREIALPDRTWIIVREIGTRSGDIVRIETDISALKRREDDLRAAKELAEKASRTKSNFLALVSHELRTPLNAIIGFSEIISRGMFAPVDPRHRDYAADIHQSGQYLLKIINDILDMAKVEAGKVQLEETTIDLSATLCGCLRVIRVGASAANIQLKTEISPDLHVKVDEMRLTQVVLNLLSNSIKFTPAGGTVKISASIEIEGTIAIRVADSGIGMSAEEIPRALAPFEQADSSVSRRFGGTGLGLPLAKVLTELHGGALEIVSAPGHGTCVTVRLPKWRVLTERLAHKMASPERLIFGT